MSKKQKRILWPVLTILSIAAGVFVIANTRGAASSKVETNAPPSLRVFSAQANTNRSRSQAHGVESAVTIPVRLQGQSTGQDTKGLVIALRPFGFTPTEIELTDGHYLFIVQNRCGIRDLTFELFRDTGEKLLEVNDRKPQWKKDFDLHPGTYVLSVVDHPTWRCVITVKSH